MYGETFLLQTKSQKKEHLNPFVYKTYLLWMYSTIYMLYMEKINARDKQMYSLLLVIWQY